MNVRVEAAKAPAMIGPQLTADDEDSTGAATSVARMVDAMDSSYRMNSARRMMIGIGTPSSQSRMPRPMIVSYRKTDVGSKTATPTQLGWLLCDQAALAISLAEASANPVSASSVIDSSPSVCSSSLAASLMPKTSAQRFSVP